MSFLKRQLPLLAAFALLMLFFSLFGTSDAPSPNSTIIEVVEAKPVTKVIPKAWEIFDWKAWVTCTVFILTFIGLIKEIRPPDMIMLASSGLLLITGILSPRQFLKGFSNEMVMTIGMLCVVVRGLEINGVLMVVATRILSVSHLFFWRLLTMMAPMGTASAFLNNTPIVLLMTPMVRRWALEGGFSPSKFLIPLSFATILGGTCTIIGTSTNIIVSGLLSKEGNSAPLSFFELSYVGIPIFFVGLLYLVIFSWRLLPDRLDPKTAISEEAREFIAEFIVQEDCPFANKRINEAARKYFRSEVLIQIERNHVRIDSPGLDFLIIPGDRLVFAGDVNQIAELHTVPGLRSAADPQFKLDVKSSHFSEIVIPNTSLMIGKTLRRINFRTNYGASVFAVYRGGRRVQGNVGDIFLEAGDTLMLISGEPWQTTNYYTKDFYYIRQGEKLQVYNTWRATLAFLILAAMVVAAVMGVPIMIAAITAAFAMVFTGNISIREAQNSIMWSVLLLIACSFALAKAITITGVAAYFAEIMLALVGSEAHMLIAGVLLLSLVGTELLSNNAAALVLFPIAVKTAGLAGYVGPEAIKAVGVAIAIGCSCAFALPTGYQTNMIVYGPGGYRFTDFLKIGIPLKIIVFLISVFLIPYFWPM